MILHEFEKWIRKLERRFGRRPMTEESIGEWYSELREIPGEAWTEICSWWWEREKHFPTPGEFKDAKRDWLAKNQETVAWEYTACGDCFGHGGYIVEGLAAVTDAGNHLPSDTQIWITCTCREAPEFRRWRSQGRMARTRGLQMTRGEIVRAGGHVVWPTWDEEQPSPMMPAPADLTERIGHEDDIPF